MDLKFVKSIILVFFLTFSAVNAGLAGEISSEQEISNIMRMIGHQILLDSEDETTRILPIEKHDGRYAIKFENDILFIPGAVVSSTDSIMVITGLAKRYLVELEDCSTGEIVYSNQVNDSGNLEFISCSSRTYSIGCYNLLITLTELGDRFKNANNSIDAVEIEDKSKSSFLFIPFLALVGAGFYFWKKKEDIPEAAHIIPIGEFLFDQRNMKLSFGEEQIELTGKEADLLYLLYSSVNETIERDVILNKVWGDEGDYVGRTLDVFISKLRKKLVADPNVKIANIRGVGYRLVID